MVDNNEMPKTATIYISNRYTFHLNSASVSNASNRALRTVREEKYSKRRFAVLRSFRKTANR